MLGIILVMVAVRAAFRIPVRKEAEDLERSRAAEAPPLARANLEVANPNLAGMPLEKVPTLDASGIVVSRIWQDGTLQVPRPETRLRLGDVLLAVGTREELDALRIGTTGSLVWYMPISANYALREAGIVLFLAAAVAARLALGLNYLTLCGLLAGSMTDPPAVSFATPSRARRLPPWPTPPSIR